METEKDVQYDEISLKELIQTLLDGKLLIAIITIAALVLSALYAFVFVSPSYQSSSMLAVMFKDSIITPYGQYDIPFQAMEEYTSLVTSPETLRMTLEHMDSDMSLDQLRNSVSAERVQDTNLFMLTATAASSEEAYELASIHTQSFMSQLNLAITSMVLDDFLNSLTTYVEKYRKDLERNEVDLVNARQLLEKTEKAINLENALISQEQYALIYASEGAVNLENIQGDIILTQELNPSYLKLLEQITDLEIQRDKLERNLEQANQNIEELLTHRQSLVDNVDSDIFKSVNSLATAISEPELEAQRVGPSKSLYLAIGLVLGLMLGIFVALFKAYWEEAK